MNTVEKRDAIRAAVAQVTAAHAVIVENGAGLGGDLDYNLGDLLAVIDSPWRGVVDPRRAPGDGYFAVVRETAYGHALAYCRASDDRWVLHGTVNLADMPEGMRLDDSPCLYGEVFNRYAEDAERSACEAQGGYCGGGCSRAHCYGGTFPWPKHADVHIRYPHLYREAA